MAARGRKPKSPALKILHGDRAAPAPAAPPGRPECPAYLDDEARAEWGRIVPELEAAGLLTPGNRALLALYCNAFSRWMRARKETADVVGSTDLGSAKANPAVAVEKDAEATMLRVLAELGMTPASRSRVGAAEPRKESKLAAFLGAGQRKA